MVHINLTEENTVILACSMIQAEVEKAMRSQSKNFSVCWMEKSLHEHPENLKENLQTEIDKHRDKQWILLAYGLCGNGILGLTSPYASLVIPRFDDCIRLLQSHKKNASILSDPGCLYFTDAWMDRKNFIFYQMEEYRQRYGEEKCNKIMKLMLSHYHGVRFIDTGLYDIDLCRDKIRGPLDRFHLDCAKVKGTLRILEKLIRGMWDSEFCIIPPGEVVTESCFEGRARCSEIKEDER